MPMMFDIMSYLINDLIMLLVVGIISAVSSYTKDASHASQEWDIIITIHMNEVRSLTSMSRPSNGTLYMSNLFSSISLYFHYKSSIACRWLIFKTPKMIHHVGHILLCCQNNIFARKLSSKYIYIYIYQQYPLWHIRRPKK